MYRNAQTHGEQSFTVHHPARQSWRKYAYSSMSTSADVTRITKPEVILGSPALRAGLATVAAVCEGLALLHFCHRRPGLLLPCAAAASHLSARF